MGHRRSHSHTRASKRESSEETATHSRVKYDTNNEHRKASDKNKRHKHERKRKREQEYKESSRKKHREKYKGENHHHKSKEKSKTKVSRRKDDRSLASKTSGSENSTSSRGAYYHCRTHKVYPPQECGDNANTATSKHRSKRLRVTNTAHSKDDVRETYEALKDTMDVENLGVRGDTNKPLVQVKDVFEEVQVRRRHMSMRQDGHDATILRTREHVIGLDGRKDKVLEVELRQRALANFLRHQDPPCKMDECTERINPPAHEGATLPVFNNEQAVPEADSRAALRNAVKLDVHSPKDSFASSIFAHISHRDLREASKSARSSSSNLEEGEIASDTENAAGSEHVYHVTDEAKALSDKDNTQTEAQQVNTGKLERLDTDLENGVATRLKEKQQVPQEHAADVGLHVALPAAAQHDVDDSFQQKTMSVMRGGEMVQVSYKVYIPKRAAELARRRLHR